MRLSFLFILLIIGCNTPPKKKQTKSKEPEAKKEKVLQNGLVKKYYSDGKVQSAINFKDGIKHGVSYAYFPNGNLNLELTYENGKRVGQSKRYYENGKLYQTTEYKENLIDGYQKKYRENGALISESRFEKDEPCLGLKEYLLDESIKKNYPSIIITPIDELSTKGRYTLKISMSDKTRKVKFYEGKLTSTGCFHEDLNYILLDEKTGVGSLVFNLPPKAFLMKEVNIIASIKTTQGNTYVTQRTFNLSIEN